MAVGRDLVASLVLKLRDGISGGLAMLQRRLDGLGASARRIGAIGAIGGGLFGAAAFAGPIAAAAQLEGLMRSTAINASLSGPAVEAMIARERAAFEELSKVARQSINDIAKSKARLIASGLDEALATTTLPLMMRVATASRAAADDIARTGFTVLDTLKVAPAELERAFAGMIVAGKAGAFELKAMAAEFPVITAGANALGMTGVRAVSTLAAALQIAKKGAATEAEAANNLANFLGKLSSPETVKNFADMGVDLPRVMARARKEGLDPFLVALDKIRAMTKGDPVKLGKLFGDMQVLNFLRPMLDNIPLFLQIRKDALAATGEVIDTDFASNTRGLDANLTETGRLAGEIGLRLGEGFGKALGPINEVLKGIIELGKKLDTKYPGLLDSVLLLGTGLVGLGVTLAGIALAFGALASPIGIAAALLAGFAAALLLDWEQVGPFFDDLWDGIKTTFGAAVQAIEDATGGKLTRLADQVMQAWEPLRAFFKLLWDGITSGLQGAIGFFERQIAGIAGVIDRLRGAIAPRNPGNQPSPSEPSGAPDPTNGGFFPMSAPGQANLNGKIEITLAPGLVLRNAEADAKNVSFVAPDRGMMLGRA